MKTYFGQEMILGTYFLNVWLDLLKQDDIQEAFKSIEKNPIKAIPTLIQAGVNSTNDINEKDEHISFIKANQILDANGGLASEDLKRLISDLAKSLNTDIESGKQKPKAKTKK